MAPEWAIWPLALLATMASVIASQALISGVFSLTVQAVQLDYLPRLAIRHTSGEHQGQIYVPLVNWAVMCGSIGLVIAFRTSSNLAAAYGIAVTSVMVITTIIFGAILRSKWKWSRLSSALLIAPMLAIDLVVPRRQHPEDPRRAAGSRSSSPSASSRRWPPGGKGRQLVAARIHRGERPVADVLDEMSSVKRVPGTAVFLFKDTGRAPPAMVNNLRHNKVLHKSTLIVSVDTADVPRLDPLQRAEVTRVEPGVHQVLLRFGFMEEPDVPAALATLNDIGIVGLHVDIDDITYFIGRESIIAGKVPGMHPLREQLFVVLNRGADSASRFFNLPPDRVFEVGSRVEI